MASSHSTLSAIYLAKPRAGSASTSRAAKLHSAVLPQPVIPIMHTGQSPPPSSGPSRQTSRPSSARPLLRSPPSSGPSSSPPTSSPPSAAVSGQSFAGTEKHKFMQLLADIDNMFQQATIPPELAQSPSGSPPAHPAGSPPSVSTSQSLALLPVPQNQPSTGRSRPSSATTRTRSSERNVGPPDPQVYMSRKGKTALQKLSSQERDASMGFTGFWAAKQRGTEESKEPSPTGVSPIGPMMPPPNAYYTSYSNYQLQKELALALETITRHEESAKVQREFHENRVSDLEKQVNKWKRLCDIYRTGFESGAGAAPLVIPKSDTPSSSPKAAVKPSAAATLAVNTAASSDEYEDDTQEEQPKPTVVKKPSTPSSKKAAAASPVEKDEYDEDFDDEKPKATTAPATKAPAKKATDSDEYDEDIIVDDSAPVAKPVASPSPKKPAASETYEYDDDDYEDRVVEPVIPKPAPASSSLVHKDKTKKHAKKPSVTFADPEALAKKSAESGSTPRTHKASAAEEKLKHDQEEEEADTFVHHAPHNTSQSPKSGSSKPEKSPASKSPKEVRAEAVEAEKQRRAAEIDSMFPSDEDDETIIKKHKAETHSPASSHKKEKHHDKKSPRDAVVIVEDDDHSPPSSHKKKKKHHHKHHDQIEEVEDENSSLPASPKKESSAEKKKKKKKHHHRDAAEPAEEEVSIDIDEDKLSNAMSSLATAPSPKQQKGGSGLTSLASAPGISPRGPVPAAVEIPKSPKESSNSAREKPEKMTSLSSAPTLSPSARSGNKSPFSAKSNEGESSSDWKEAPSHSLLAVDKHGRSPTAKKDSHHEDRNSSSGSGNSTGRAISPRPSDDTNYGSLRPASPAARGSLAPLSATTGSSKAGLSPASSARSLAPIRAHESSSSSSSSHASTQPLSFENNASTAPAKKLVRPSSATRDGSRNSSRPSSASSRESSRPSSASRSRPQPLGSLNNGGIRPPVHPGPSSSPTHAHGGLAPIKSNSSSSAHSSGPLSIPALDGNKAQPFIIVRDEDEGDEDNDSDLYGEEDIPEEESFNVQHAE